MPELLKDTYYRCVMCGAEYVERPTLCHECSLGAFVKVHAAIYFTPDPKDTNGE
jgi:DNA-directed RNA polymerase subunit RPC12/RpoP